MFSDPQSVTISSVAQSLPRVSTDGMSSTYSKDDETIRLSVQHQTTTKGRVRRTVRMDVSKIAADPFVANQSRKVNSAYYVTIDEPADGVFSNAELLANMKGLVGWSTDANLTKVIAGES